jgi:hypothetical protein
MILYLRLHIPHINNQERVHHGGDGGCTEVRLPRPGEPVPPPHETVRHRRWREQPRFLAALHLLDPASGDKGETLSELLGLLGARSRDDLAENVRAMVASALPSGPQPGGPRVLYASSGLWHDASRALKPAYCHTAATSCRAVARAVDFRTKVYRPCCRVVEALH